MNVDEKIIPAVIDQVLSEIKEVPSDRSWLIMHLYKHEVGNKLPRGKMFDPFRGIEKRKKWESLVEESTDEIQNSKYSQRISSLFLTQITLMTMVSKKQICSLNSGAPLDTIKFLEKDGKYAKSTELLKSNIPFSNDGVFASRGYMHHHTPVLPDSYSKMFQKESVKKRLIRTFDKEAGSLNIKQTENEIRTLSPSKGGRMTGHWIVSKNYCGDNYYLGIFPHSTGAKADDMWILNKCISAEKELNII